MIEYHSLVAPLLGGVIGYITNDIAIRMLFRPHRAKYFCGLHIPFTPGIIPKEKGRIAEAIGAVISENLMNQEVLQHYLLSEDMIGKVRSSVEAFINEQKQNYETVEQFVSHYLTAEEISVITNNIRDNVSSQVQSKLTNPALGEQIAHMAMNHVVNKLGNSGAEELLAGLGGMLGGLKGATTLLIGGNIVGKFLEMLREPTKKYLAKNINDMLKSNGSDMASSLIGDGIHTFMSTSVATLLANKDEQLQQVANNVVSLYKTIVTENLPKILESIDICKIVRERIMEMDVAETEKLIFKVMDKELKAIVWLGALLGMIMGSINILF
ncbi:DUF445 family protein [uncultured Parabacteroides sp.]|jgi:uncharacterized membrane protein YheB (UPF0754 family)|uniref:DUF445 domain-containing protein n=1 Tax=uncultured Parabacteroides sp. TaxID=512312 RepID=UPI0025DF0B04|nr:DUF445 family protein [uncultured Parabacteroides sp.]